MRLRVYLPAWCIAATTCMVLCGCGKKPTTHAEFTKADSLTETYLALQDTMLQVWNTMIHDDNRKINAMHRLLDELGVSHPESIDEFGHYEERLDQLVEMRYDQHSMSQSELVSEYDFASNSLVSELVAFAETQPEFASNSTIQKLVDAIRAADQRVNNYRAEYDGTAMRFNRFIERNRDALVEVDIDSAFVKKPLFQMAAE